MEIYRYTDKQSCMLVATNTFLSSPMPSHSFSFYISFRFNIHFSFHITSFLSPSLLYLPFLFLFNNIFKTLVNSQNDVYLPDFVNSISFLPISISRAGFIALDKSTRCVCCTSHVEGSVASRRRALVPVCPTVSLNLYRFTLIKST